MAAVRPCEEAEITPYISVNRERHNLTWDERIKEPLPCPQDADAVTVMAHQYQGSTRNPTVLPERAGCCAIRTGTAGCASNSEYWYALHARILVSLGLFKRKECVRVNRKKESGSRISGGYWICTCWRWLHRCSIKGLLMDEDAYSSWQWFINILKSFDY